MFEHDMEKTGFEGINSDLLRTYGAISCKLKKGENIFEEALPARFYFQLLSGKVRMYNTGPDGKEFTQGFFGPGNSFGEPPLFVNAGYPASAQACCDSVLLKLSKDKFLALLREHPETNEVLLKVLSYRVLNKAHVMKNNAINPPETRILELFQAHRQVTPMLERSEHLPFTRQEIAHLTGLRVETVIRAIGKLADAGKISIRDRKIYL